MVAEETIALRFVGDGEFVVRVFADARVGEILMVRFILVNVVEIVR